MNKIPKKILALVLALTIIASFSTFVSPAPVVLAANEATLSGNGVYVEVDDNMSMTVYRVEKDGTKTQMTQPITPLDGNGATAVGNAWRNALPWSAGTGTAAANFNNGSAKLLSAKSGYVTTGTRSTGSVVGNEVAIDDFLTTGAQNESNVKTYFGTGNRLTVTGVSASRNLTRIIVIETTNRVPGVISVTSKYINNGATALSIARFVENNYKIYDPLPAGDYIANKREAGLWTQQGATLVWGADYVLPMYSTMGINTTSAMDATIVSGSESPNPTLVSRNNWFWGENGGLPFNDYWGTNVGILVGCALPYLARSSEIPTRGSGITNQHDTAYTWVGFRGQTLQPGVETNVGTSIVGVHTGDNYTGSKQYTQAMSYISDLEINGVKLPSDWLSSPDPSGYEDYAWDSTWESWGGGEGFDPMASVNYVLDGTFKSMGIKYIILDAAWYPRSSGANSHAPGGSAYSTASVATSQRCGEGFYIPVAGKWANVAAYFNMPLSSSSTDADVKAVVRRWNDFMHENGFKTAAWCMPMSFFQGSTLNATGNQPGGFAAVHPDYPITSNAARFDPATGQLLPGSPSPLYKRQCGYYPQSGTAEICLGNPKVLNDYTDYFTNLIFGEYGFDGLKIDTQWGTQTCQAIGHGHDDDPEAGFKNYAMYWKLIYDKAKVILGEDPWIKHCQCGTMMSFFTQNGTNRPITGDPGGSNVRKARYSMRMWKGLYGDNCPAVSDHCENFGNRLKSLMAAGYVLESKFFPTGSHSLTQAKRDYFALSHNEGIARANYLDLYKFGFDFPEVMAFEKPEKNIRYYSIFASNAPVASFSGGARYVGGGETTMTYAGPVELRGLEPFMTYSVKEFDGARFPATVVTADANGNATVTIADTTAARLTEVMILKVEVLGIETTVIDDGSVKVTVDDNMSMQVFRNDGTASAPVWVAMTQPITNFDAAGATALTSAPWKSALPWSTGTGTSGSLLHNNSAKLLSAKSGYITTGTRSTGNLETAIDDFVVTESRLFTNVKTYFGTGNRLVVTGESASRNLTRIMEIETTNKVSGVVSITTKYKNNAATALNVARFVESNFKIYDPLPAGDYIASKREAGLWTQQGAALVWGRDYVVPMFSVMGTNTTTAMNAIRCSGNDLISRNNWFWGENGGLPFNDFWGTNVGILVGSAMPYNVRSMEMPTRGSGITNQHDTAYTWVGFPGMALAPGVETKVGTTIVGVHTGDNYQGSRQYTQAMSYISDLELFGQKLPSDYFAVPDPNGYADYAWEGTWESWGGSEGFDPYSAIGYVLNGTFKNLGIKYVILDAAWYPRGTSTSNRNPGGTSFGTYDFRTAQRCGEGNYIAIAGKWATVGNYFGMPLSASSTDDEVKAVVRRWNKFMNDNGFKTAAWCMPMSVYLHSGDDGNWNAAVSGSGATIGASSNGGVNNQNIQIDTAFTDAHPDYLVTFNAARYDPDTGALLPGQTGTNRPWYRRQSGYYPQDGTGELCLGNPRVLNEYTDYFCTLMFDKEEGYGFDGLKIDTQWGISPCNAIGHGHDGNPNATYEGFSMYWKIIYDKAKAILGEDPWIKHCQCGTMMNFFTQPGTNRPITGDPGSSNVRKARYSMRMWKGLYGDNAPAVSDHVENFGTRCKSLMAAGYVMESKFYNANGNPPTTAAIVKYFPMANKLGMPSGYYMDEYKFGFAYPEIMAYDKPEQNAKYYSIFASSAPVSSFSGGAAYAGGGETTMTYSGGAELRGLTPGAAYCVTVIDNNNSGNDVILAAGIVADANGNATVNVSFTECAVLKVEEIQDISIAGDFSVSLMKPPFVASADYSQKLVLKNTAAAAKSVSVILAAYADDGKLAGIKSFKYNLAANSAIFVLPSMPLVSAAAEYKFFVWQDEALPMAIITSLGQLP